MLDSAESALGQFKSTCMLFTLHSVPVAFSANSKLVRDSVVMFDTQVVTGESESGESEKDGKGYFIVGVKERVCLVAHF